MLPDRRESPVTGDPTFAELRSLVVDATRNYRLSEQPALLAEKLQRRLQLSGLASLDAYLSFLKNDALGQEELDFLIAELTVGETSFFRHPEHFDTLRDTILPACLKRNEASRQLRIWSAGCSNGAEAYSIAIIVDSVLGAAAADWNVSIVGSDINRAFLANAEAGTYSSWAFRNLPESSLPLFFTRNGDTWTIREKYKANVTFVKHNIITEEVPSLHKNIFAFDVVFCRNVMIYFDREANARLTDRLAKAMVDDGCLFVAPADFHSHLSTIFETERVGESLTLRRRPPAPVEPIRRTGGAVTAWTRSGTNGSGTRRRVASRAAPVRMPERRAASAKQRNGAPARPAEKPAEAPRLPDIRVIIDFANRGDWSNASHHCDEILRTDSCNVAAHYYRGLVLQYTGATAEAEEAWRRTVYLDRAFALAHYQIGLARKDAKDLAGSRKAFVNTIEALKGVPDERSVSPCDEVTANDLRELATQQLGFLADQ